MVGALLARGAVNAATDGVQHVAGDGNATDEENGATLSGERHLIGRPAAAHRGSVRRAVCRVSVNTIYVLMWW